MLRRKISKTDFDALPDALKSEYKANGNDYVLDVDDATELLSAKQREKERADAEARARRDAEAKLVEATRKISDLEADPVAKRLERELETERKSKSELENGLKSTAVESAAMSLATQIGKSPKVLSRFIADRLTAELEGGKPVVKVLDKDGKPSALTMEDLGKEFVANKDFSDIIVASKASGGSAPKDGLAKTPSSATANPSEKPASLASMKPAELAAHVKATKESTET